MTDPVTGLMQLGLTEYEAKAYVAVVTIEEGGIGEISQESGIPRARVYDIMERLAGKGFVEIGSSKPLRYRANDPKRIAEDILAELKDTVDDVTLQLNTRKKKSSKILTPAWIIPDDRGIDIRLKELLDSSTSSTTIIAVSTNILQKYASTLSDLSHRVKVKAMIFPKAESYRGLLGETEILEPDESWLAMNQEPKIKPFPSRKGKRAFKFEFVLISDSGSLVVYQEEDERMAMSIDDSIIDSFLRYVIEERIPYFKHI